MNTDSYITVTSQKVHELAVAAIERCKVNVNRERDEMLARVEEAMRARRWWGWIGPWYTGESAPSDDTIALWIEQTARGSGWAWSMCRRRDWDRELDRSVKKLRKYILAAKDGDPFLLTLEDYNMLAGI